MTDRITDERLAELREEHMTQRPDAIVVAVIDELRVLRRAIGEPKYWRREDTRYPDGRIDFVGLSHAIATAERELGGGA